MAGKVIYVMQVTDKMTMQEYDQWTIAHLPNKIPIPDSRDLRIRCGDSIYEFGSGTPRLRPGSKSINKEAHPERDLRGGYVLLSSHFFYFGDRAIPLPEHLLSIVLRGRGQRSTANKLYYDDFLSWFSSLSLTPRTLYGNPQQWLAPPPLIQIARRVR
jgi:hypothetical protein